jgi:hypothetical protein
MGLRKQTHYGHYRALSTNNFGLVKKIQDDKSMRLEPLSSVASMTCGLKATHLKLPCSKSLAC